MLRAVLWDLDGTIADTESYHFRSWRDTLSDYGVRYDYDEFFASFGRRNSDVLAEKFGVEPTAALVEEAAQRKEAAYRGLIASGDLAPMPYVVDWLRQFKAADVVQTISSSGPMANIAATVHKLDL